MSASKSDASSEDTSKGENVKSCAVVKYAAVDSPAKYAELHSDTDLKLPPANWLRESHGYEALKSSNTLGIDEPTVLSSFQMACNFPNYIGEVDVVSDSENIKKLLKIPFSKSQISMVVHRIGKTILLDDFDIHRYLLRTAEKEWDWLRKFYLEHVLQSLHLKEKAFPRKNKSRYYLQNKSMFSKFLYHSIDDAAEERRLKCERKKKAKSHESSYYVDTSPTQLSESMTEESEYKEYSADHKFLRDVLWTFEDITMLIGSNMPIFGGGTHPCVSLRLRERNNPINILTGLDYWLDNLMCNVPEVVMCYHLDGIVQQYEFLKTEEIPQLKNSQFSPQLIKDIAQNILSFLKTKATKAGHTYWLFKGKDDDVVKLYDLSSLCEGYLTETNEHNPFAMHVAFLLHTVARSLYSQQHSKSQRQTMHILLQNCLSLLDDVRHPQVVTSSHFLLADLYLLGDKEAEDKDDEDGSEDKKDVSSSKNQETSQPCDSLDNSTFQSSSSVEVESLCVAHKPGEFESESVPTSLQDELDYVERCKLALRHIIKGIVNVDKSFEEASRPDLGRRTTTDEVQEMARPFKAIPLHYSPLRAGENENASWNRLEKTHKIPMRLSKYDCGKHNNHTCWLSHTHRSSCPLSSIPWQIMHKIHLLKKGALALSLLSEHLLEQNAFGPALRNLQLAVFSLEASQSLSVTYGEDADDVNQVLQKCMLLAGDIHHKLGLSKESYTERLRNFETLPEHWDILTFSCKLVQDYSSYESVWQMKEINADHLRVSLSCYKEVLATQNTEEERWKCKQRIGSTYNELAVKLMIKSESLFHESQELTDELSAVWKESNRCFLESIVIFKDIKNVPNLALVMSNLGRLTRLYSHFLRGTRVKEFDNEERRYYQNAKRHYEEALAILKSRDEYPMIWDTIAWEYCTTLNNMGNLLQDFAPLSTRAQEDIEKEVLSLFDCALRHCDVDSVGPRQILCQYRAATIHRRIASLYHNAVRNDITDNSYTAKDYRMKAEYHYEKAGILFRAIDHVQEYLRVQLENVGMHEFLHQRKSGFSSRVRSLTSMLQLLLSTKEILAGLDSSDSVEQVEQDVPSKSSDVAVPDKEPNEAERLLIIVGRQLESVLSKLLQLHEGKKGQKSKTEVYKKMHKVATSLQLENAKNVSQMITTLESAMNKLQSLLLKSN